MKPSNAILRGLGLFVAVCVIQAVAGALFLANVRLPSTPHDTLWLLLSNFLIVASLTFVAFRSHLRGWLLGAAMAAIPLAVTCLNYIEGVVFLTHTSLSWPRLFAFSFLSAILVTPLWTLLFGRGRGDQSMIAKERVIAAKPFGEKIWRFVVCDVAYSVVYLTAGTIIFPYVKDFYATQYLPPMTRILALQLLLRGPLFVLLCIALVRLLRMPRWSGALAVGVVFTILSAIAPLLIPNPILPEAVRWVHMCETTGSNFIFGILVALLWGPRAAPHGQLLRQAA